MLSVALLQGCSVRGDEVKGWMKEQEAGMRGKVEKIPDPKAYVPVDFTAKDNPFVLKPIVSLSQIAKNRFAPDFLRKKETLEQFSVESLKMTGFFHQNGDSFAMIKAPDRKVYSVGVGHYLGVNFGKIIEIKESTLTLEERVQDSDEWVVKKTVIHLADDIP